MNAIINNNHTYVPSLVCVWFLMNSESSVYVLFAVQTVKDPECTFILKCTNIAISALLNNHRSRRGADMTVMTVQKLNPVDQVVVRTNSRVPIVKSIHSGRLSNLFSLMRSSIFSSTYARQVCFWYEYFCFLSLALSLSLGCTFGSTAYESANTDAKSSQQQEQHSLRQMELMNCQQKLRHEMHYQNCNSNNSKHRKQNLQLQQQLQL